MVKHKVGVPYAIEHHQMETMGQTIGWALWQQMGDWKIYTS